MRLPRFITGLAAGIALSAQAVNTGEYINQLPTGANSAFMAQKVGASTPEVGCHSQQMALPASIQKVITALVALLQLGPDFHFTTALEIKSSLDGGMLRGDLITRLGDNPASKRRDIHNMVVMLKKAGVQRAEGNVLIGISVFVSHDKTPGWPWNGLTQCFSAPPAAAIVDHNCLSVPLCSTQRPGDPAFIRVASYYPVTMSSQVRTLARGSTEIQYCELDVVPDGLNYYTLTGCLPQRNEPLPLASAIQSGTSYAGAILKVGLIQVRIIYSGMLLRQALANDPGTVLAATRPTPLHDLLRIMLKKSDSMIADTILRTIGHTHFDIPGTWWVGSDAIRQILRQQAGADPGNMIIADGSGLSRHNLIAPAIVMQVLQYIAQHNTEFNFISMLPLAGHDGSLQYHVGLHRAGADGKVSAKTGSLQRVYNLAGFIITASGQKVTFMQYPSGHAMEPADQHNRCIPLVRFESRLYKDLYQNS